MKSYNGFSPEQRWKALRWARANPKGTCLRCDNCGTTEGYLAWHSEDYSEPFSRDHIGRYGLCFTCHMMVHCRFRNRDAFNAYVQLLRDGAVFAGTPGRDFPEFARRYLNNPPADQVVSWQAPRESVWMETLG